MAKLGNTMRMVATAGAGIGKAGKAKNGHGRTPNYINAYVGGKVRTRRMLLGVSQEELAGALGLTFQQIQKYEHGTNRISASRLFELAKVLNVSISWFFDGLPLDYAGGARPPLLQAIAVSNDGDGAAMDKRETLDLVRSFLAMPQGRRDAFLTMALRLGDRQ